MKPRATRVRWELQGEEARRVMEDALEAELTALQEAEEGIEGDFVDILDEPLSPDVLAELERRRAMGEYR